MTESTNRIREFKMPDVGEGLTEAEILKWYVQPGDTVTDGQVVCEVETAKAAVELPIPFDGAVHELRFGEGTTVDVGMVIISVDTDPSAGDSGDSGGSVDSAGSGEAGETGGADGAEADGAEGGGGRQPVLVGYGVAQSSTKRRPRKQQPGAAGGPDAPQAAAAAAAMQSELNGHAAHTAHTAPTAPPAQRSRTTTETPAAPAGERPLAKPPVRKLARDLGIDLTAITPTGPDGVITRDDVRAAAAPAPAEAAPGARQREQTTAATPAPAVSPTSSFREAGETRTPVKGVRKATAQAMVNSAFTAPHVTEFVTVDVTRTVKLVRELKQDPDMAGLRVNPMLLVARAFLLAIRRHPEVNATWDEANQEIVRKDYVNLGIAAATPRGLIVPNIKDAQTMTLPELATALAELVATAREGRTAPAAMRGGTVTITNVGVFGVDTGTPILNPGESAILAFGQIREQPWVHKGKVKPRHVTTLALSFDHRFVDGELGSLVLADVAAVLERPKRLIAWS